MITTLTLTFPYLKSNLVVLMNTKLLLYYLELVCFSFSFLAELQNIFNLNVIFTKGSEIKNISLFTRLILILLYIKIEFRELLIHQYEKTAFINHDGYD